MLTSIRLEAEGTNLNLVGCDGELWAAVDINAQVEVAGSVCVPSRLLNEVVSSLPDGPVELEMIGTQVLLRQGRISEWRMAALPADEFPLPPAFVSSAELTLSMGDLRQGVALVDFAVSEDGSRPVLNGVYFHYDGEVLTLVATDTHRLAVHRVHREGVGSSLTAIVPQKALRSIRSIPVADDTPITIRFDDRRVGVEVGPNQVVGQLLEGNYPNWERVVPSEFSRSWTLDRQEFLSNIDRSLIIARTNSNRVRLKGEGETVVISARSEDMGEAREEVACVSKNGEIEIAFNARYLRDVLRAINSDGVRAEMTEPSRPAVIRPVEGGESTFCVVMPMALG